MHKISHITLKRKLPAVLALVVFLFLLLVCRLFYIQIIDSTGLQTLALDQWTRDLPYKAERGDITDRNGVVLASSQSSYTVYVRPNDLSEHDKVAKAIASATGADFDTVYKKVIKTGVSEVRVATGLTKNEMLTVSAYGFDGVYFTEDATRYYNYGNFATQLLGFTNSDGDGQSGIEQYYNTYLKGTDGASYTQTDLIGRELDDNVTTYLAPIKGMTAKLTIDFKLQSFAEKAVNDAVMTYSPKSASCLMMNADTGEILAMASAPTFDLNDIPRNDLSYLLAGSKNLLVTDVYEPGSTFKILTSAIGIATGVIKDSYYCPGYKVVDGQRIKCWRSIGHGSQDFAHGIMNSCNCVFMDIALSAGTATMYDYFEKFGLTQKTGIDISGEGGSIMLAEESVKTVDIARIGFGQAIAVTPIGLAAAVASVINGGKLVTPYVLDSVYSSDGKLAYRNTPTIKGTTVSEETSAQMREYLYGVVEEGGGKNAYVEGYRIGGKTGTAQKYKDGAIDRGAYVSSFIGFTEISGERILCLMKVDEPEGYAYYGSIVAAPLVGQIFRSTFAYYGVEPTLDPEDIPTDVTMPDIDGLSATAACAEMRKAGLTYEVAGEGSKVVYQFPAAGAEIDTNTIVYFVLG